MSEIPRSLLRGVFKIVHLSAFEQGEKSWTFKGNSDIFLSVTAFRYHDRLIVNKRGKLIATPYWQTIFSCP